MIDYLHTLFTVPKSYPQHVNGTSTPFSIKLRWSPPLVKDRNGVILHFSIYHNTSRWNVSGVNIVGGQIALYIISNLDANTNYSITIKAATTAGYGPSSPPIVVTTKQQGIVKFYLPSFSR